MADVVAVPKSIREKLGDDGSNDLVELLNTSIFQKRQEITKEEFHEREKLELRFEKGLGETEFRLINRMDNGHSELEAKIENVRSKLEAKVENVRSKLEAKIENVRSELKVDIEKVNVHVEKTKSDIIRWMFIFWTGTVITILGGLFGILNLFFR